MRFLRIAATGRIGTLVACCLAFTSAQAEPCANYRHHGLAPGMSHTQVWEVMGGKGRQSEVVVPGEGQRATSEYLRDGLVIEVEYDRPIPRRGEALVVRVETRFTERAVDSAGLLRSLVDVMGPPAESVAFAERGLTDGPARWVDEGCGVEVTASRHVPEWWEPGSGPAIHVQVRSLTDTPQRLLPIDDAPRAAVDFLPQRARPAEPETSDVATTARGSERQEPTPAPATRPKTPVAPGAKPQADDRDRAPVVVRNPPPEYPAAARIRKQGGRVVLSVLVNDAGRVEDVSVSSDGGSRLLQDAAVRAVRRWSFEPALRNGEPVSEWTTVAFSFDP